MTNHSCQSDSVLLWKAIATGHNDILELISTILDELLELNGKFLLCCDEKNGNLEYIIGQLEVLIQNLIDCCEGICDRLDTIIEILEEKYPEGVEYGITYDDYICVEEWDCDVGGEFLECNFEDCLPEPPEIEYEVTWDDYICIEECVIGAGLIEVLCEDWTSTTTGEPATTTTTQVGTTTTTTALGTTTTTTLLPTTTTTTVLPTTTTTTTVEPTTTTTTIIEPKTEYGYLYNWWAAIGDTDGDDSADTSIANTGWHVPSVTELRTLLDYLGASGDYTTNSVGGKLKETGTTYWDSPNTDATNEVSFNARGSGTTKYDTGLFDGDSIKTMRNQWSTSDYIAGSKYMLRLKHNDSVGLIAGNLPNAGNTIRLIKNSTTLTHGQTGTYTGNNGITYPTICIGTQEWLSKDLEETKFRDGSNIPYIDNEDSEGGALWVAATSAAYCIHPIT